MVKVIELLITLFQVPVVPFLPCIFQLPEPVTFTPKKIIRLLVVDDIALLKCATVFVAVLPVSITLVLEVPADHNSTQSYLLKEIFDVGLKVPVIAVPLLLYAL